MTKLKRTTVAVADHQLADSNVQFMVDEIPIACTPRLFSGWPRYVSFHNSPCIMPPDYRYDPGLPYLEKYAKGQKFL